MPDNYVFGYGSLIERASRTRTNPEAIGAWPARVKDVERGWFHRFAEKDWIGNTCTFLGAKIAGGKTINGVIYKVNNLQNTIDRETGYTPKKLEADQIEMLDGAGACGADKDDKFYIFISDQESISKGPTAEVPIVQSYVDMCIGGCLEIDALYRKLQKPFTKEFIETTTGWNEFWVNARLYPRRPLMYTPNAQASTKP